jgi:hypothetical protein
MPAEVIVALLVAVDLALLEGMKLASLVKVKYALLRASWLWRIHLRL